MLKIIPLGGLGEIGLNMMVVEYEDTICIIDAGIMFPEDYMLGVDMVIPAMDYIRENREKVQAVIVTHAHEDHIGALPYLLREFRLPVYGTRFTLGIVRNKLVEHELNQYVDLNLVNPGETLSVEPFDIEFIRVSHSTIDGVALAISTPVGVVIHTGDFRICNDADPLRNTDIPSFVRYGDQGVLALLSDSTNVEAEGYTMSEQEVSKNLDRYIAAASGRVIVALFASNVLRIQQIIDLAVKHRRKVVINGRSMEQILSIAHELGYMNVAPDTIVDIRDLKSLPDDQVVVITTGSQGEPMSALARMATGMHKHIAIKKGDLVMLSSKHIPGNEKAIDNIINQLYRRGAEVVYSKIARIHTSGHAHQEELKLMLNLTRPRFFIPVHGEYRHLVVHARLAEKLGIPKERVFVSENGRVIVFDEDGGRFDGEVQTGRILVDGKGIGDVGRSLLRERRELSEGGLVVVTMVLDEDTGLILHGPDLVSRGFVFDPATGYVLDDSQCVILDIMEDVGPETENRVELIRKRIQKALKQHFSFTINRKPLIVPIIIEV